MKKSIFISIAVFILLGSMLTALSYGLIVIDGYFDDWDDKPHSEIWNGRYDEDRAYSVSLFADGENLYIHVVNSKDTGNDNFDGFVSQLKFNGSNKQKYTLQVGPDASKNNVRAVSNDSTDKNGEDAVSDGGTDKEDVVASSDENAVYGNDGLGKVSVRYKNNIVGHGIYVNGGNGYGIDRTQVEYCIPLSNLTDSPDSIKEIALKIPPYGKQEIIHSGISTGPIVIIAIGFIIAIAGYFIVKRNGGDPLTGK